MKPVVILLTCFWFVLIYEVYLATLCPAFILTFTSPAVVYLSLPVFSECLPYSTPHSRQEKTVVTVIVSEYLCFVSRGVVTWFPTTINHQITSHNIDVLRYHSISLDQDRSNRYYYFFSDAKESHIFIL